MSHDLRVRLRNELVAFLLQFFFELKVVFDDSVVHHDNLPGAVAMRMSIFLGWPAVRGPARVADAVSTFNGRLGDGFFEVTQLSRRAANLQLAGAVHDGDARGIVAAVFEFAKALDDHRHDFFRSDVSENSAHKTVSPQFVLQRNTGGHHRVIPRGNTARLVWPQCVARLSHWAFRSGTFPQSRFGRGGAKRI